jgi:hypothetical protein
MNRFLICLCIILISLAMSSVSVSDKNKVPVASSITFSNRFIKKYSCIYQFLKDSVAVAHPLCAPNVFNLFFGGGRNRLVFDIKKLPEGISGQTGEAKLTRNGVFSVTIYLSDRLWKQWSKEYLVAVVLHEGVHAYTHWCMLSYSQGSNGVDSQFLQTQFPEHWQWLTQGPDSMNERKLHILMSENHIAGMKRCIYDFTNPALRTTLRDSMALALAWGGLNEVPKWKEQMLDTCYIQAVDGWARGLRVEPGQFFVFGNCDSVPHTFRDSLRLRVPCQ